MAEKITFPDSEPRYLSGRDCLAFDAVADDKPVECLITTELLFFRYGAGDPTEASLREAYQEHLAEIQEVARTHIKNGWIDEEGRVVLMTRFTRMKVTFSDTLGNLPGCHPIAHSAHRILTGIIGPNAEGVEVTWYASADTLVDRELGVLIADPETGYSTAGSLPLQELANTTLLTVYLAGLWSNILRARSRKLSHRAG